MGYPRDQRSHPQQNPPQAPPQAPPPLPEPAWDPDAPVPFWRRPIVLAGAGLGLVVALFAGLWAAANSEGTLARPTPSPIPTPSSIVPSGPPGKYGFAGTRATDKTPLKLSELFGSKKITKGTRSYVLTTRRSDKVCKNAISGTKIEKALKAGGCTQLLRASYKDAKGTIIGTVGVANLKTEALAKKVTSAGAGKERKDFLKPLPGKDAATKLLGDGDAYAGGWVHGHYAVLLWFQFKDGHLPSKAELKRLYLAALDITDKTVFPALDTRSLTGGHG